MYTIFNVHALKNPMSLWCSLEVCPLQRLAKGNNKNIKSFIKEHSHIVIDFSLHSYPHTTSTTFHITELDPFILCTSTRHHLLTSLFWFTAQSVQAVSKVWRKYNGVKSWSSLELGSNPWIKSLSVSDVR